MVSVPRQTGKTTLIHAMGVHRAAVLGKNVHYTAQTGKDARARWTDLLKGLRKSDTWQEDRNFYVSLRGGAECVHFHGNTGPGFHAFAPVENCLHGSTPAAVVLDEAFAHSPAKGAMLMGAISPAQQTILAKQVWIVSTAGTAQSTFLHNWIAAGERSDARVALFLWAAPDDRAPYTADGIEAYHPGVGFRLNEVVLTADAVLEEINKNSPAEYVRAFGNRRTLTTENLIPVDVWTALKDEKLTAPPDTRQITLSYEVDADRRSGAIVATWNLPDGRVAGKVVQASAGTSWLATAVDGLVRAWRPADLVAPGHGPVLDVTEQLRDLGHTPTIVGGQDFAAASSALLGRIEDKLLAQDGGAALGASVIGLAGRPDDRGGIVLSRRLSVGDSSPGIALAVGLWITERKRGLSKPVIEFA